MDSRLVYALRGVPQHVIIDELGWDVFLKYKVACYWGEPESFRQRCGFLGFLGMTEREYAEWVANDKIDDRVKRVWS